jgi:hypothetical protein
MRLEIMSPLSVMLAERANSALVQLADELKGEVIGSGKQLDCMFIYVLKLGKESIVFPATPSFVDRSHFR